MPADGGILPACALRHFSGSASSRCCCSLAAGAPRTGLAKTTTATATLVATDDAYVNASQATKNYSNATTLQVDASPIVRSYLKFDLSSINGTVTGAC